MNFKDAAFLRYRNIKGDILTFVREKTKNTRKAQKEINVYLCDEAKQIINEWGNTNKSPDSFVFPMLSGYKTVIQQHNAFYRHKRVINNSLTEMGKKLGFEVHLCLNLARHSFATTLKLNGTPVSFITDAMGHSSSVVTEHYLKSLPTENLKAMSSSLLAF